MIVRIKGNKYNLPDIVQFGDSTLISPHYTYEVIDYREPREGEYYLSGAEPHAYQAPNNLSAPFLIVKQKEKMVLRQRWVAESTLKEST
jgi:hypothetical protein